MWSVKFDFARALTHLKTKVYFKIRQILINTIDETAPALHDKP